MGTSTTGYTGTKNNNAKLSLDAEIELLVQFFSGRMAFSDHFPSDMLEEKRKCIYNYLHDRLLEFYREAERIKRAISI